MFRLSFFSQLKKEKFRGQDKISMLPAFLLPDLGYNRGEKRPTPPFWEGMCAAHLQGKRCLWLPSCDPREDKLPNVQNYFLRVCIQCLLLTALSRAHFIAWMVNELRHILFFMRSDSAVPTQDTVNDLRDEAMRFFIERYLYYVRVFSAFSLRDFISFSFPVSKNIG